MKNLSWGLGLLIAAVAISGCSDPSADLQRRMASRPKPAGVRIVNFTAQPAEMLIKKVSRINNLAAGQMCMFQTTGGGKNILSAKVGGKDLFEETVVVPGDGGASIVVYDTNGKTEHLVVNSEVRNAAKEASSFRVVVIGSPDAAVDVKLGGAEFEKGIKAGTASAPKEVQGTPAEVEVSNGKTTKKMQAPLKNGDAFTMFVYVKADGTMSCLLAGNSPAREPMKGSGFAAG